MKLIYATNNKSKIDGMNGRLKGLDIEMISPYDLEEKITVIEDGKTVIENALKKAKAYYDRYQIPTIACDSGLYIKDLPEDKQPGLYIRRINGKELSDAELLDYYINLVKSLGDNVACNYVTGIAIITNDETSTYEVKEEPFILTSKISPSKHKEGFPLDSISIDCISGKYYVDLTEEDKDKIGFNFDVELVKFIKDKLHID